MSLSNNTASLTALLESVNALDFGNANATTSSYVFSSGKKYAYALGVIE